MSNINALLAQGFNPMGAGRRANALMQMQQLDAGEQKNALMQFEMQKAQQQAAAQAQAQQQAAALQQQQDAEFARVQGGGKLDPMALMRLRVPQSQIEFMANAGNLGRQKVARVEERRGADGNPERVMLDEFGGAVGGALPQAVKMQLENMGGNSLAINPYALQAGQQFKRTQTPDSIASNATAMRGQNMANDRARETLAQGGKAPAGYRWKADGTMEAIPGGPADLKQGGAGAKVTDANDAIALLNQAEPLLKGSTGSYGGAGIDMLAQVFGAATPGSVNAQQLKAIEGALVAKMPKMSGPQSDKDVLLYRQMAAVIGDETVPYQRKAAAVEQVRAIQERYAGMPAGSSKPAAPGGVASFGDAAKEQRYQEWKRSQGQK